MAAVFGIAGIIGLFKNSDPYSQLQTGLSVRNHCGFFSASGSLGPFYQLGDGGADCHYWTLLPGVLPYGDPYCGPFYLGLRSSPGEENPELCKIRRLKDDWL